MSSALRKIEDDAFKLPARCRARLAERLITSLEETAEPQAEREWLLEIERRSVELKSGKIKGVPAGKVFKKARSPVWVQTSSGRWRQTLLFTRTLVACSSALRSGGASCRGFHRGGIRGGD
jgi:putative addiction module component (TIGR02574 family)